MFGLLVYNAVSVIITFHLVCIGWILFRAVSLEAAILIMKKIYSDFYNTELLEIFSFDTKLPLYVGIITFAYLMHVVRGMGRVKIFENASQFSLLKISVIVSLLIISIILLHALVSDQFIYFQF